jgi:hypothetical protein
MGNTDVTKVLAEEGASLSAVDNEVIKPSVKLIKSNIKLFKVSHPKTINIKHYLNTNNFSSNLHKQHNFILQKYFINNSVVIIT